MTSKSTVVNLKCIWQAFTVFIFRLENEQINKENKNLNSLNKLNKCPCKVINHSFMGHFKKCHIIHVENMKAAALE